jgi:phosphate transport system permease protein
MSLKKRKIINGLFALLSKFAIVFVLSAIFLIIFSLGRNAFDSLTDYVISISTKSNGALLEAVNKNDTSVIKSIVAKDLNELLQDEKQIIFRHLPIVKIGDKNTYKIIVPFHSLNKECVEKLKEHKALETRFRFSFFVNKNSSDPSKAGIFSAFCGTVLTAFLALIIAVPLSLCTAIYLVEFSKRGFWASIIELNLFNLASIPSILYSVIGFVIYLQLLKMERASSLVGGMTLMLMSLPHLVITYMGALRDIPSSIKDASYALGVNKIQTLYYHSLRYALPSFITGTILVLARIAGETAPLLLIGMIAFITEAPSNIFSPTTTMASQIYLWTQSPEPIFVEMASAAIMVLLLILFIINLFAQLVRKKFTIKW